MSFLLVTPFVTLAGAECKRREDELSTHPPAEITQRRIVLFGSKVHIVPRISNGCCFGCIFPVERRVFCQISLLTFEKMVRFVLLASSLIDNLQKT